MRVVVDTTVWSLALRRPVAKLSPSERALVEEWRVLIREGRVLLVGVVRQEVLSGIARADDFVRVRDALRAFDDVSVGVRDHEAAAECFNQCRAAGIQGSTIDFLLCAVARREQAAVLTTDQDFAHYAIHLSLQLHAPRAAGA